jgi:hypothetical protein
VLGAAALCLALTVTATESPASAGAASTSEPPAVTRVTVELSHPVSLPDAVTASQQLNEPVVAYAFTNSDIVGEYSPLGQSVSSFLEDFEVDYGTQPQITGIVVEREVEGERSTKRSTTRVAPAPGVTSLNVDAPELTAAPLSPSASMQSMIAPPEVSTSRISSQARAASAAAADWRPNDMEGYVESAGNNVSFMTSYYWHTGSRPDMVPTNWGLEFEVNLYNSASSNLRPACLGGYKERFAAQNYGYSWKVIYQNGVAGNLGSLGAYQDINDLSDPCNRNSMAIGLRYPQRIASTNGGYGVIFVITAPKGTEATSKLGGVVQAVSDDYCRSIAGGSMSLTDCMGVYAGSWPSGRGPQSRITLNPDKGKRGPTYCWTSFGKGEVSGSDNPTCASP